MFPEQWKAKYGKPSKSKEPTDAETLRALQFALAPLDRAMRDAGVETWPRQLMHRTVATRPPWSQWDEAAEREADLRHESLMADETEYGPRCNLPDDEGWRNV